MRKNIILALSLLLMFSLAGYPQSLGEMQEKSIHTDQGTWSYLTNNSGSKALLFIHGAGSGKRIWKYQYALQLKGCKNIFVDLLGYGASDKPDTGYTLARWVEGIDRILQQEGVREVTIVAHSNGVILAKEYYRAHPSKVARLLLLDGMLKQMIQEPVLEWMRSTLERSDYRAFMENTLQYMPVAGLDPADAELLKEDALNTPKGVTKAELALVSDPATWKELTIQCPVTIIHANNPTWGEAYIEWLSEIAPGHRLIEWKDAGHFIPLQYPDRLNQLIVEVVTGQ